MRESDYYPAGAYSDPNAPYNECEAPEIELDVTVTETLVKGSSIVTNDAWYVYECEEGSSYKYLEDENLDARKDYEDQHLTLPIALQRAKEEICNLRENAEQYLLKLESELGVKRHRTIPMQDSKQRKLLWDQWHRIDYLKKLEDELSGWEQDDIDVEVDK